MQKFEMIPYGLADLNTFLIAKSVFCYHKLFIFAG
jgi:hypothetical protein